MGRLAIMSKHKHVWYLDYYGDMDNPAVCACQERLSWAEIERRLNAVEEFEKAIGLFIKARDTELKAHRDLLAALMKRQEQSK